jgi:hypothetical protein
MDHSFADVGQYEHDEAKAQAMTNEELTQVQEEGRLYVNTWKGDRKVGAINFHGDGRYSTADAIVYNDSPMNGRTEYKVERADLRVQMKGSDRLQ